MFRSVHTQPAAPAPALLTLTLATALSSCEAEAPVGEPTRETLPNGAVLVRYPDLPAIDSVGPEVAEAHVDRQFGSADGADPNLTFGDYLGSVRLAFTAAGPLVIRSGTIYTWIEDDLEVPYVVRAPLSWGRSSRLNGGPHDRDTDHSTLPRG